LLLLTFAAGEEEEATIHRPMWWFTFFLSGLIVWTWVLLQACCSRSVLGKDWADKEEEPLWIDTRFLVKGWVTTLLLLDCWSATTSFGTEAGEEGRFASSGLSGRCKGGTLNPSSTSVKHGEQGGIKLQLLLLLLLSGSPSGPSDPSILLALIDDDASRAGELQLWVCCCCWSWSCSFSGSIDKFCDDKSKLDDSSWWSSCWWRKTTCFSRKSISSSNTATSNSSSLVCKHSKRRQWRWHRCQGGFQWEPTSELDSSTDQGKALQTNW
jgi:hypothetical protein